MCRFGPLLAFVVTLSPSAWAEDPPARSKNDVPAAITPASRPRSDSAHNQVEEAARSYFERALTHYRAGRYHDAVRELDAAFALDPSGKDLAYNLAIVHERLGQLREAVAYLRRYVELESDPAEIANAREAITRIEGARVEEAEYAALAAKASAPSSASPSAPLARAAGCSDPGRWDGWVTGTGGAAVVAMVVGVAFGVGSLIAAPGDEGTSSSRSIDDLRRAAAKARTYAQVADIAFGVGVISGATAGLLYFGRDAESDGSQAVVVRMGAAF